jgi:hypothetical protein
MLLTPVSSPFFLLKISSCAIFLCCSLAALRLARRRSSLPSLVLIHACAGPDPNRILAIHMQNEETRYVLYSQLLVEAQHKLHG